MRWCCLAIALTLGACTGSAASKPGDARAAGDALADGSIDASTPIDAGRDFSTDRTLFFGASRCAQSGTQLCEDFETGTLDTTRWKVLGTAPVIDTIEAARGTHALHITMPGNGSSRIEESETFPEAGNAYYGRAFVYFKSLPTPTASLTYAHWTVIAGETDIGEIRISGQMQNGKNLFGVGTDSGSAAHGTGDWTNSDKDPDGKPEAVPTGQWLCLEWLHDSATSETKFWWDATEHPSLDTTPTVVHGGSASVPFNLDPVTSVALGWYEYQASTEPFELWIDEVAIDSARIGCID